MCQDIGDVSGGLAGASSSGGACGGVVVGDVPGSRLRPRVLGEDLAVGVGDGDPVGVPGDQGLLARSGAGDEVGGPGEADGAVASYGGALGPGGGDPVPAAWALP